MSDGAAGPPFSPALGRLGPPWPGRMGRRQRAVERAAWGKSLPAAETLEFDRILEELRSSGPLPASLERCHLMYELSRRALALGGDVAEFGVERGATAHLLAASLATGDPPPTLHLVDAGEHAGLDLAPARQRLERFGFCAHHPGAGPDALGAIDRGVRFALVHVDVETFPAAAGCLRWFWPRMLPGGVLVVDDFGVTPYRLAVRAAIESFFAERPETPQATPTGQGVVVKQ